MKRLVLVGAGHANAQVLKDWAAAPLPGVDLCVVSPTALAPYSGRVPGWLAGRWRFDEIGIDFAALARAAGARFVHDEVQTLDVNRREMQLRSGAAIGYDLLALNVGSTLTAPAVVGARVLALRPLGRLQCAWDSVLSELGDPGAAAQRDPLRVTAVGGGAAGAETLLAVMAQLRHRLPGRTLHGRLVSRSDALLPGHAPGAVRAMAAALERAGVTVQLGAAFDATLAPRADLLLWATGAEAHAWQRGSSLAVSDNGFIRIDALLRSVSHPAVYAVGDCAAWAEPLPKSGVHAVRMGPVLSRNLRAALGAGTANAHTPQRRSLALLATADGAAIASYGRWSAHGRWVARWKDHLDQQFLDRMRVPPEANALPTPQTSVKGDSA